MVVVEHHLRQPLRVCLAQSCHYSVVVIALRRYFITRGRDQEKGSGCQVGRAGRDAPRLRTAHYFRGNAPRISVDWTAPCIHMLTKGGL